MTLCPKCQRDQARPQYGGLCEDCAIENTASHWDGGKWINHEPRNERVDIDLGSDHHLRTHSSIDARQRDGLNQYRSTG